MPTKLSQLALVLSLVGGRGRLYMVFSSFSLMLSIMIYGTAHPAAGTGLVPEKSCGESDGIPIVCNLQNR